MFFVVSFYFSLLRQPSDLQEETELWDKLIDLSGEPDRSYPGLGKWMM